MCFIYWLDTNWLFTFLFFAAIINAFVKTSVIWGRYPLTAACVLLLMDFCDFHPFNFCPVHLLDFCRLRDFQLLWLLPFWCVTIFLWHDWQGNRLWCAHLTTIQHCTPLAHIVRRKNLKTLMVKSEIDHITLGPRCLIQIFVAEGIFRHLHKDCLQTSQELQMLSSVTLSTYMYITISAISSPILWVAALCMCYTPWVTEVASLLGTTKNPTRIEKEKIAVFVYFCNKNIVAMRV